MMRRDMIEIGTAILGGLGIGAAAMYLFDPEKGLARRNMIRQETQEMMDKANRMAQQAGRSFQRGKSQIQQRANEWMPSSATTESSCAMGEIGRTAMPVISALALGAGLMFFLDPTSGRRRRSMVRDKAVHYTHQAEDTLSSTGRHLSNKAKGMYHGAMGMVGKHHHDGGHQLGAVEEHGRPV